MIIVVVVVGEVVVNNGHVWSTGRGRDRCNIGKTPEKKEKDCVRNTYRHQSIQEGNFQENTPESFPSSRLYILWGRLPNFCNN